MMMMTDSIVVSCQVRLEYTMTVEQAAIRFFQERRMVVRLPGECCFSFSFSS